jgi:CBS domain containing-hemolysin-like protein
MVDGNKKLKEVIDFVVKTPFSRYPVYEGDSDKITGILDVDDVLEYMKNKKLDVKVKSVSRPIYFIPETKEIDDLLAEFEGKEIPVAMVVDEYGDISGLVTVEDILEEIVGEIFDKSDRTSLYIKPVNEKLIHVDARASIDEVNKKLRLGLQKKQFNTIAGFIEHKMQKIPKKGEKIKLRNIIIEINEVTRQGIKSVKIIKP